MLTATSSLDVEILSRVVHPENPSMPPELARCILEMSFAPPDHERMNELAEKASDGNLTEAEQNEIDSYERVGTFLAIIKSKARQSLDRTSTES